MTLSDYFPMSPVHFVLLFNFFLGVAKLVVNTVFSIFILKRVFLNSCKGWNISYPGSKNILRTARFSFCSFSILLYGKLHSPFKSSLFSAPDQIKSVNRVWMLSVSIFTHNCRFIATGWQIHGSKFQHFWMDFSSPPAVLFLWSEILLHKIGQ